MREDRESAVCVLPRAWYFEKSYQKCHLYLFRGSSQQLPVNASFRDFGLTSLWATKIGVPADFVGERGSLDSLR